MSFEKVEWTAADEISFQEALKAERYATEVRMRMEQRRNASKSTQLSQVYIRNTFYERVDATGRT
jgi:hypothetical protein